MPAAVLALILLTEGRRPARLTDKGDVVLLSDQDRSSWDRAMIAEGQNLLAYSLRRTGAVADPYQLQAAIAAEHDRAPNYHGTDWNEIIRLYDLLLSVAPSAPAALSRAVAIAERDGPASGLATLVGQPPSHRWHAVRSELLAKQGRYNEAVAAVTESLTGDLTGPERRFREGRRAIFLTSASRDRRQQ